MNKEIPVQNPICYKKDKERLDNLNAKAIMQTKGLVDHGIPKSQKIRFLKDKVHQEKIKEIKNYKVEYENTVLLNKITSIMEQQNYKFYTQQKTQRTSPPRQDKGTLNKNLRKKEIMQIAIENEKLLQRLQQQKSIYDVQKWNDERKKTEIYMYNITKFKLSHLQLKPLIQKEMNVMSQTQTQRNHQLLQADKSKKICQKTCKIGLEYFFIEVYIENEQLMIVLKSMDKPLYQVLQFPQVEGMKMIRDEFNNDIDKLLEKIKYQDGRQLCIYIRGQNYNFLKVSNDEIQQSEESNSKKKDLQQLQENFQNEQNEEQQSPLKIQKSPQNQEEQVSIKLEQHQSQEKQNLFQSQLNEDIQKKED